MCVQYRNTKHWKYRQYPQCITSRYWEYSLYAFLPGVPEVIRTSTCYYEKGISSATLTVNIRTAFILVLRPSVSWIHRPPEWYTTTITVVRYITDTQSGILQLLIRYIVRGAWGMSWVLNTMFLMASQLLQGCARPCWYRCSNVGSTFARVRAIALYCRRCLPKGCIDASDSSQQASSLHAPSRIVSGITRGHS